MAGFVVVFVCSLWMLYEYIAFWGYLNVPFLHISKTITFLLQIAGGVAVKWAIVLGLFGLVYSIVGFVLGRGEKKVDIFWPAVVLYGAMSFLLIFA